jgi:hypothetical protein
MRKVLVLILVLVATFCFPQEDTKNDSFLKSRKGKLFLGFSPEYRIAAYYKDSQNQYFDRGSTNLDKQLSGSAISYSLNYFITNNLSFGFSHSFKNSLLVYDQEISTNNGAKKAINSLFMDYHFYLDYYIPITIQSQIFLRVGKTILNSGSDYSFRTNYYDTTNKFIGYSTGQESFIYYPENYAIGFKKNRIDIMLGIYKSKSTPYFKDDTKVTVSYIKLNYNLLKL